MMSCFLDLALASRADDEEDIACCSCEGKHCGTSYRQPNLQENTMTYRSIGYTREEWIYLTKGGVAVH
jgi:hypothetical protein